MAKYWNKRRLERIRERRAREQERAESRSKKEAEHARTYTAGDARKNTRLMLDALGLPLRRKMVARLARGGAMSLSKLAEPFHITLPSALKQLRVLEDSGIVSTRKQGRTRICFLNRGALNELTRSLVASDVLFYLE